MQLLVIKYYLKFPTAVLTYILELYLDSGNTGQAWFWGISDLYRSRDMSLSKYLWVNDFFNVFFCCCSVFGGDLGHSTVMLHNYVLTMSGFCFQINFSITIQPRLTIFGPHIDHGQYMSARHVSPDLELIFSLMTLLYLCQVLVIRLVSHYHTT
jgi:hypothetical protein